MNEQQLEQFLAGAQGGDAPDLRPLLMPVIRREAARRERLRRIVSRAASFGAALLFSGAAAVLELLWTGNGLPVPAVRTVLQISLAAPAVVLLVVFSLTFSVRGTGNRN